MTTIAATKTKMAADTQVTLDGITFNSQKIFKFKSKLFKKTVIAGAAGCGVGCDKFLAWVKGEMDIDEEDMKEVVGLVITGDKILYYDFSMHPMEVSDDHFAIGVGSQAALAIMDTGGNPKEAVEAAMIRNPDTGGDIDYLTIRKPRR